MVPSNTIFSVFHHDTAGAERFGNLRRMGDEQKRDVALHDLLHLFGALIAERAVADGQRPYDDEISGLMLTQMEKPRRAFIPLEYVCAQAGQSYSSSSAKSMMAGSSFAMASSLRPKNAALEVNVFAAGKFLVKAACELQKRADDAVDVNFAACGERDAGDHFKHGGFARAVAS